MTDALDLVKEAVFAAVKGDSALAAKLTDAGGRFGFFLGGIPAEFGLTDKVAALTLESGTALAAGSKESVTVTLAVAAHTHALVRDVAADLIRLLHPSGGRMWRPLALKDGAAGFIRREFADDAHDPASELRRRILRFRAIVGGPRAA